jgi:pyrroline-5-carboxylate reductase
LSDLYTFIGGGNMGRALIGGLISNGQSKLSICVADKTPASRDACTKEFGVAVFESNILATKKSNVIILAVKPKDIEEVSRDLNYRDLRDTLIISIAAGITCAQLEKWLGKKTAIIRAMPNTPALIGLGITGIFSNKNVNLLHKELATKILGSVGKIEWLEEEWEIDAVTAVSGSGPAYFFLFYELLENAAVELGLYENLSRELVLSTAKGAIELALSSEKSSVQLRTDVTSPGGTTEKALKSLKKNNLDKIIIEALIAARDRSTELSSTQK